MTIKKFQTLIFFIIPISGWCQDFERIIADRKDSTEFRIVIRTEENTGLRQVTIDNLTILVKGDTTHLYYMRYGDGLVSRLMIPFDIKDELIGLEEDIIAKACPENDCEYSVLIESSTGSLRIPIDVLDVEMISSFMLSQEE